MSTPRVHVVIVNWNLAEDTLACLASVFETGYPSLEAVVIDNGSVDGSVHRIRRVFPDVGQIVNQHNEGFARAANQGIRHALDSGSDYVMTLNNDTIVAPNLLEHLVTVAQGDANIGILAPRIMYFDKPDRTWHLAARWHSWQPRPIMVHHADHGDTPLEVDFVSGCGMMLTRYLLEEVGGFDDSFFMYGEDVDLCARAKQAGYKVVAVPRAHMWHKVSASACKISAEARYWRTRNQILVYRRYPHGPLAGWLPAYVILKAAYDIACDLARGQLGLIRPLLRGTRDGLCGPVA